MRKRASLTAGIADIEVVVRGTVPDSARDYAEEKITALARYIHVPILHARIRLTRSSDPAVSRPALVQVNLDVNGRLIRAQLSAKNTTEAIDLVHDRLRLQLERMDKYWPIRKQTGGVPGEWRRGQKPDHRPPYFPLPPEQRQVIRHKAFELPWASPDEAAFDMDLMDYDFHLFSDVDAGDDAVIYRGGPTGYRIAYRNGPPSRTPSLTGRTLTVSDMPAPRLSLDQAKDRLDQTGFPFSFYADESDGRARVLYRRYDGHYGLITPAE